MYKGFDFFGGQRQWSARWIWKADEPDTANSFYLFRKTFTYHGGAVKLYITAETRYRLYINGAYVGCGSLHSFSEYKYYDALDITTHLTDGDNIIAVVAYYMGEHVRNSGNARRSRGGLLAELRHEDGTVLAATDDTWKTRRADAYASDTFFWWMAVYNPYQEVFDARRMPVRWEALDYDDGSWAYAGIIRGAAAYGDRPPQTGPWFVLQKNDLPVFRKDLKICAAKVIAVEENLDYINRIRPNDLSIALSVAGEPIRFSTVRDEHALLQTDGVTVMQNHLSQDGVYSPYIVLDFGRIVTAYLELTLEGTAGAALDIGYSERLINGHFNIAIENPFADRLVMKDGFQTYRPFTWKAFRYIRLQLHDAFSEVRIHQAKAVICTYPFEERGRFVSSDAAVNQLFDICRYTTRLCSNEGIYDTPWREQGQFTGDASMVTLGLIYACFGDTDLVGKYLRQCAETQLITGLLPGITNAVSNSAGGSFDYTLHWVNALYDHYQYTGDENWIHMYYPHVSKIIFAIFRYRNELGLFSRIPHMFLDWAKLNKGGENTVFNALMYGTLDHVRAMAALKGDAYMVKLVTEARTQIKRHFISHFYNAELGLLMDGNIDGALSDRVSEHANCAAILWDLGDDKMHENIINRLYVAKDIVYTEAQPFFSSIVLQALMKRNRIDLAMGIIRERWIKRMVSEGASSTYEEWTKHGSWRNGDSFARVMRTESHAWSAFPAAFFIKHIAGIRILSPGGHIIAVSPQDPGFDFTAVYPLPHGEVGIQCEQGQFRFTTQGDVVIERA